MKIVFDTETTGFPLWNSPLDAPTQPHIVQLAAALYQDDGKEAAHFNFIIKHQGLVIPEELTKIHGISTAMAQDVGVSMAVALSAFGGFLRDGIELVAHNLKFDLFMLRSEVARAQKDVQRLSGLKETCTMHGLTNVLKIPASRGGYKWPSLTEAYQHFYGCAFENAHNGYADAQACAAVHFAHLGRPFKVGRTAPAEDSPGILGMTLADCPERFSNGVRVEELATCLEGEVKMRRIVFPKRVAAENMTQAKADEEIKLMHTAACFFRNASQLGLQLS